MGAEENSRLSGCGRALAFRARTFVLSLVLLELVHVLHAVLHTPSQLTSVHLALFLSTPEHGRRVWVDKSSGVICRLFVLDGGHDAVNVTANVIRPFWKVTED